MRDARALVVVRRNQATERPKDPVVSRLQQPAMVMHLALGAPAMHVVHKQAGNQRRLEHH